MTKMMEQPLTERGAGLDEHCKRVSLWARVLAQELKLPHSEEDLLSEAAILHHTPREILRDETVDRILADLGVRCPVHCSRDRRPSYRKAKGVLRTLRLGENLDLTGRTALLAEIVEAADYFDQQLEAEPLERNRMAAIFESVRYAASEGILDSSVVDALCRIRRADPGDVMALIPRLPVYPTIAIRALQLLSSDHASLADIEKLCTADQVLAGQLLKTANSGLYGNRTEFTSVRQAISYIGTDAARRITLAASLRPLFASAKLRALWRHSVEAAKVSERIAASVEGLSAREGFLLGLMHDIGRLALTMLPKGGNEFCAKLIQDGCEPLVAELVVFGCDHAEAGAEVLSHWNFPPHMLDAVRHHHHPERARDPLAAVLYVAEYWMAAAEDLPSHCQLERCLRLLRLDEPALAGIIGAADGTADFLME